MSPENKKQQKALKEKKGVTGEIPRVNPHFDFTKPQKTDIGLYVSEIKKGNIVYLSKAITLIESTRENQNKKGREILKRLLPHTGNSVRIGITGVPGVGKSTFIEKLGAHYIDKGHKVAVLAVDPSSSITKGSILGDKTRMEELSKNPNAFIRPTASGNAWGGVARKTRESILLCEAAGFDRILVETVGVGQSETLVHSMTDFFLLLKLAGAGDELQGIKRGIMEMADLIVINKAEKDNISTAQIAQKAFQSALHFYPPKESGWKSRVLLASALYNKGIDNTAKEIDKYMQWVSENGFLDKQRKEQEKYWLEESIKNQLLEKFYTQKGLQETLNNMKQKIAANELTAFEAADILLKQFG